MSEINRKIDTISFNVDAGLIDRLGRELVGRAETAVSELVKNAYDADANKVEVEFIETLEPGGTLVIKDDGVGMTLEQLKSGFMTISSTDKIHNPKSAKYQRNKAGRKGIGRFATQRLGKKLTIITQTFNNDVAIKLTINWDDYKIDSELIKIQNKVEFISKTEDEGTTLIIEGLREWWSEADIKRIYRYVADLLQPNYISDRSAILALATQSDESFKVTFTQTTDGQKKIIADPERMLYSKALAIIEGFVDQEKDGYCNVTSNGLDVPDDIIPIPNTDNHPKYLYLKDVHFKVYYFIYDRERYYNGISKMELLNIKKIANEQGGVKLYRNGFRVLPYGEQNDDWLNFDRRYFDQTGVANIPFGNKNLFGFVEIIDSNGELFEETASREGLIEDQVFKELTEFLHNALEAGRSRLRYAVEKRRKEVYSPDTLQEGHNEPIKSPIEKLEDLAKKLDDFVNTSTDQVEARQNLRQSSQKIVRELKGDFQKLLDELGMLRVLAGLGLTIGEFTHEVVQFTPSIMGDLSVLSNQGLNERGIYSLENLKRTIQLFTSYTSYFNATVSANVSRELKPHFLAQVVSHFKNVIKADLEKLNIILEAESYGFDLITIPMHSSEWTSILFNLYTNAKKAIKRQGVVGKIKIVTGKEDKKLYLEFADNGDGIPENNKLRIFEPFFTTSSPVGFDSTEDEKLTGTGLGLKIVKDIIQTYGGTIELVEPESGYSTCFKLELPIATAKQIEEYEL